MTNPFGTKDIAKSNLLSDQGQTAYALAYLNPWHSLTENKYLFDRKGNVYHLSAEKFEISSSISSESIRINHPKYEAVEMRDEIAVLGDMSLDVSHFSNSIIRRNSFNC